MPDSITVDEHSAVLELQSPATIKRLKQISSLRARGVSQNVDLPQLVVCGDQSAGKSSVLEGITGIPFPREEGVCTKFATEVILEHDDGPYTTQATIIPHSSRQQQKKLELSAYERKITGFEELPSVIAEVGALMGLRGYGDNRDGPSFVNDVLQIRVTGPSGLHLSIVDLPGLISNASEDQTEADVHTVHHMVDGYVSNPRTIILAVIQASNDVANQSIIRKSKEVDKAGQRTVGIITKPDLINEGSEGRIAALAKNQDTTKLKLGFFMLKNPSPKEREANVTSKQRAVNELRFFQSTSWKKQGLDTSRLGIDNLKEFLTTLLDGHIERELPKVREELNALIRVTEQQIASLPPERPTTGHLRMFLSEIAMHYNTLATAAINGEYHTSQATFFALEGGLTDSTRLRALVNNLNTEFSHTMRLNGKSMNVVKAPNSGEDSATEMMDTRYNADQKNVTEAEMKAWVRKVHESTRGRELPGNSNHVLLTELFHEQSRPWHRIARDHVETVHTCIVRFVDKAISYLKIEPIVLAGIKDDVDAALEAGKLTASEELTKLWEDEQQAPATYNHYYTDNVQKARIDAQQDMIERVYKKAKLDTDVNVAFQSNTFGKPSFGGVSSDTLISALRKNVVVDMDEQACSEAMGGLKAYYKVARKSFVDNVCKQVIERHLMRPLPMMFSPQIVAMYTDEDLERIAGEKPEAVKKREQLREQLNNLKAGLRELWR